jgi:hypothetical protein
LFSPNAIVPKSITFTFPGVSSNTNIWQATQTVPDGVVYLGNNLVSSSFSATNQIFDVSLSARIMFRGPKAH